MEEDLRLELSFKERREREVAGPLLSLLFGVGTPADDSLDDWRDVLAESELLLVSGSGD